jgi:D-xylose transport system permease protein
VLVLQVAGLAVVTFATIWFANQDRGVPTVTVLLAILLVIWTFVASRLRFGRHVYAVGGNPEAARRAGINVDRVRIMVFMISGFMAGVGGIMLASRARSVATSAGGGNLLLNVIAAAVIGGTSLSGGLGTIVGALLGALVMQSLVSGMVLMGIEAPLQDIVVGIVLVLAVTLDTIVRRRAAR